MTADLTMDDLRTATTRFYAALGDVLAGDPEPMFAIWSRAGDVCYSGPMGPLVVGWEPIRRSWQEQADAKLGGFVSPEELHFVVGGPLGAWVSNTPVGCLVVWCWVGRIGHVFR